MALPQCTMGGMHGGLYGYGWILQILIFIAFFAIVLWLIRKQPKEEKAIKETPNEILKRRLASGEITKKEYESLKKEIEK